jgi:hypothetical protein
LNLAEKGHALLVSDDSWARFHEQANKTLQKAGGHLHIETEQNPEASLSVGKITIGVATHPSEGYELEISSDAIRIDAADAAGAFYAIQTLAQLSKDCAGALPCATITDYPDLPVRGFMLDISRGKVPTMATLSRLVEQLAALRINQFQLYIEHTFAFADHKIVWKDSSPVTPEELQELDRHCKQNGIELVPNLQSFGHMDRWLKHAPYRHLAECPQGFFHELLGAHRAAGTLKPDQASLDFVEKLYDEYLPNFTSPQFNIGGDEPWELGRGWSKPLCEARGRRTVYLEHLTGIQKLVKARGKKMQFWADVLFENSEKISLSRDNIVPVIWGYDAGHPFAEQCGILEKLGCEYLVAPGTSSWQTFHGRLDNTLANVNEAVRAALAHNAHGVLITSWGDNGNHQPWFSMYPGLIAGATQAWCLTANANIDMAKAIGAVFFDNDTYTAQGILDYAKIDNLFAKKIRNKSLLWEILFSPEEKFADTMSGITMDELDAATSALEKSDQTRIKGLAETLTKQGGTKLPNEEVSFITSEILLSCNMQKAAILRARNFLEGKTSTQDKLAYRNVIKPIIQHYRKSWLMRAREGGLDESVDLIKKAAGL